jgi:cell division protein FtsI/penicillin-binding protein 2
MFDEHGRTEGVVDVVKALSRSNDIFFYQIGGLVGPEYDGRVGPVVWVWQQLGSFRLGSKQWVWCRILPGN